MKTDLSNISFNALDISREREKIYFGFLQNYQSAHTRLAYGKDLKEFLFFLRKHFPHLNEFEVEHAHIVAYRDWLAGRIAKNKKKPLGKRAVNRKVATMAAFYRYLYYQGLVEKVPTDRLQRYKIEKSVVTNELSDEEVKKLFKAVNRATGAGKLHYAVLKMFFSTGMRHSELTQLKFSNLKYAQDICFLQYTAKGQKLMRTSLPPHCLQALEDYLDWCKEHCYSFGDDDFIFRPTRNFVSNDLNRPLDAKSVHYIFKKYSERIGSSGKITPHSARSTVIGRLLDKGISIHRVAEFVGHSDLSTTKAYNKRKSQLKDNLAFEIDF